MGDKYRHLRRPLYADQVMAAVRGLSPARAKKFDYLALNFSGYRGSITTDEVRITLAWLARNGEIEKVGEKGKGLKHFIYRFSAAPVDTLVTRRARAWRAIRTARTAVTIPEIQEHSGLTFDQAKVYLYELTEAGYMRRTNPGARPARWALALDQVEPPDPEGLRRARRERLTEIIQLADKTMQQTMQSLGSLRSKAADLISEEKRSGKGARHA
jgi:hypothetical protein